MRLSYVRGMRGPVVSAQRQEPYVVLGIPAQAWNALCERDPVLAGQIEAGALSWMSDVQLAAYLVANGVAIDMPQAG